MLSSIDKRNAKKTVGEIQKLMLPFGSSSFSTILLSPVTEAPSRLTITSVLVFYCVNALNSVI